ncbi:hypothetical protein [Streptomyces sp. NPDC048419]|uniref:hypothetical protein n=1 Tax=Streptomyces sp. NPDC048419 TaxID=3365547 RepID=UPI00371BE0BE
MEEEFEDVASSRAEEERPPVKLSKRDLRSHNIRTLKNVPEGGVVRFSIQEIPGSRELVMVLLSPPNRWPRDLRTVASGKITMARKGERWSRDRGEIDIEVTGGVAQPQLAKLLDFTKKEKTFTRGPATRPSAPTGDLFFKSSGSHYRVHESADGHLYVRTGSDEIRYVVDAQGNTVTRDAVEPSQGSLRPVNGGALQLGSPTEVKGLPPIGLEEKKGTPTVPTRPKSPPTPLADARGAEREFLSRATDLLAQLAAVREMMKVMEPDTLELLGEEIEVYQRRVDVLRAWLRREGARRVSEVPDVEEVQEAAGWTQELISAHGKKVEQLKGAADGPGWQEVATYERRFAHVLAIYESGATVSPAARRKQSAFNSAVAEIHDWAAGRQRARQIAAQLSQAAVTLEEFQRTGPQEVKGVKGKLRNEVAVIGHGTYTRGQETFVPKNCEVHTLAEQDSYVAMGMGMEAVVGELRNVRKHPVGSSIPNFTLLAGDASETERLNNYLRTTPKPVLRKTIAVGSVPLIDKASKPPGAPDGPTKIESGIQLCNGTKSTCDKSAGIHGCTGLLARLSGTIVLTACTAPSGARARASFIARRETPRTFTDPETKETTTAWLEPWLADQIYEHPELVPHIAPAMYWVKTFEKGVTEGEGNAWRLLGEDRKNGMIVVKPAISELLKRPENLWIMAPGVEGPFQPLAPRTSGMKAWRADTQNEFDALSDALGDFEIHITDTLGDTIKISRTGFHHVLVYGAHGAASVSVSGGNVDADGHATVTTVSGGMVSVRDRARVERVIRGIVNASGRFATVGTVDGGTVSVNDSATVTTVNVGATVYLEGGMATTVNGGTVTAEGTSRVTTVNGGVVDAREQTRVDTLNAGGTVTLSDSATVTTNNGGTLNHAA